MRKVIAVALILAAIATFVEPIGKYLSGWMRLIAVILVIVTAAYLGFDRKR